MKVSLITVCFNNSNTIQDTFNSVKSQVYADIEYIVVDGGSTDGTVDIIEQNQDIIAKWISEPDEGLYDAMNKGIEMATGEVIGIINADDVLADDNVILSVVSSFKRTGADAVWGDLVYTDPNDLNKVVRNWKSSPYEYGKFELGWHPPHPTFYAKKDLFYDLGPYRTSLKISADYELMLRFIEIGRIKTYYIPKLLVKMRAGGVSNKNIKNRIKAKIEDYKAWRMNGLTGGLFAPILKSIFKITQWIKK